MVSDDVGCVAVFRTFRWNRLFHMLFSAYGPDGGPGGPS